MSSMYRWIHSAAPMISQKSRRSPYRFSKARTNRSRSNGNPPGPVGHSYTGKLNSSNLSPSS